MSPNVATFLEYESKFDSMERKTVIAKWRLELPVGVYHTQNRKTSLECCTSKSSRRQNEGRRKSVTFSPVRRVKKVEHRKDLKNMIDLSTLWFSQQELKEIDSKCREIVDKIEYGFPMNEDNDCVRGLEKLVQTEQAKRDSRRSDAIKVVLKEQKKQTKWGVQDSDYLADLYQECTYDSQNMATMIGLRDRKEIRNAVK